MNEEGEKIVIAVLIDLSKAPPLARNEEGRRGKRACLLLLKNLRKNKKEAGVGKRIGEKVFLRQCTFFVGV